MSEREFENYLILLSRLLRLNPAQRDAVADELQDHLHERLEVLIARGVSRDDAIRIALEEFGDAAGLAGEFSEIVRIRKKRWMMRVTTGTIAATAATILMAMALWPDPEAGPAPMIATAQQSDELEEAAAEEPEESSPGDRGPRESKLNAASAEKLAKLGSVEFIKQPLEDAIAQISQVTDVQFYIDRKALEDFGVTRDTPLSIKLEGVPLDMILDLMFRDHLLTYYLRNGVAIITTVDEANLAIDTRFYDIRDLVKPSSSNEFDDLNAAMGRIQEMAERGKKKIKENALANGSRELSEIANVAGGAVTETNTDRLIELITSNVNRDSWVSVGGLGTIGHYRGTLIISQTAEIHRKIAKAIKALRDAGETDQQRLAIQLDSP